MGINCSVGWSFPWEEFSPEEWACLCLVIIKLVKISRLMMVPTLNSFKMSADLPLPIL